MSRSLLETKTRLSPRQKIFVKEYLVDLNATQSAIRAGFSAKTAQEQSSRMLSNVMIQAEIQAEMDKRAEKVAVTAQDVLDSILRIRAKAEAADKHSDALRANELLGKHLKLFTDKVEVSGELNVYSKIQIEIVQPK